MAANRPFASRFACIHGHFYQPPRENPWTGSVEVEESAAPYHDWNARITAECYSPNAAARVLDEQGHVLAYQNNYAGMSFDFGPTLLSWLELAAPQVYAAVQAADRHAHGGVAQAYNHMILPLANSRDRATQVLWGSRDFIHRFGREPEGMWLPETAVDLPTLECLADAGIQFTILAPHQARRVRAFGSRQWSDVHGRQFDARFPYEVRLPSERRIAVFFYDAGIAHDVAFSRLLDDGRNLAVRMAQIASSGSQEPQLLSIATDGESYGHHHQFGEMALAAALRALASTAETAPTNYRAFLATHPPTREVEIVENSSWSCAHGVERWRSNCGCHTGGRSEWHQAWRAPLRAALDWLRDRLAPAFQQAADPLLWNPWSARNDYIEVLLDSSPAVRATFLARHARYPLNAREQCLVWNLLELQRFAMLMFTSCGWFFDDVGGLESSQILAYAARAIDLAESALGVSLQPEFRQRLEQAPSNDSRLGSARAVYDAQLLRRPSAAV